MENSRSARDGQEKQDHPDVFRRLERSGDWLPASQDRLSLDGLAVLLKVEVDTIRKMIRSHNVPTKKIGRTQWVSLNQFWEALPLASGEE